MNGSQKDLPRVPREAIRRLFPSPDPTGRFASPGLGLTVRFTVAAIYRPLDAQHQSDANSISSGITVLDCLY